MAVQREICAVAGVGTPASEQTKHGANKGLGGREGKQQTMKTNTKQGAAFTTWTRHAMLPRTCS